MDEVDGMSAGDRGGSAELIQFIKKTKVKLLVVPLYLKLLRCQLFAFVTIDKALKFAL